MTWEADSSDMFRLVELLFRGPNAGWYLDGREQLKDKWLHWHGLEQWALALTLYKSSLHCLTLLHCFHSARVRDLSCVGNS